MKYESIKDLEGEKFRRLTGVKRFTFEKMVRILDAAAKQKKVKGGRKSKLSVENRLLMALEYNKRIPYFHVSQSYGVNFKLTPRYNPSA